MKANKFFEKRLKLIGEHVRDIQISQLESASELIWNTHNKDRKIIIAGNGGSAAIASHVAIDFTKAAGIRSVNFNEASLLTCLSNDYGYAHWLERALEAYANAGDMVILISSSGASENILNAAKRARTMKLSVLTLSGFSSENTLRTLGDVNLWINSDVYNLIELTHLSWLLTIVDYLIQMKGEV